MRVFHTCNPLEQRASIVIHTFSMLIWNCRQIVNTPKGILQVLQWKQIYFKTNRFWKVTQSFRNPSGSLYQWHLLLFVFPFWLGCKLNCSGINWGKVVRALTKFSVVHRAWILRPHQNETYWSTVTANVTDEKRAPNGFWKLTAYLSRISWCKRIIMSLQYGKCPNNRSFPLGRPKSDGLLGQKSNFDVDASIEPINWYRPRRDRTKLTIHYHTNFLFISLVRHMWKWTSVPETIFRLGRSKLIQVNLTEPDVELFMNITH